MKKSNNFCIKFIIFFVFLFLIFNNFQDSCLQAYNTSDKFQSEGNAITTVLCNIITLLTGSIAKGVAMIAIIVVAVGLFMGKFSWGVGLATAIGIAMFFGARSIVEWLAHGITNLKQMSDFC